MNRIDKKFQELKEKNEKALIVFITPGCPNLEITEELVLSMEKSGADIVELGVPYSDPIADGKVIESSSQLARENGVKTRTVMEMASGIRSKSEVPLVLLVYFNSIFAFGSEKFLKLASESGVDGIIIPDLPLEEREDIIEECNEYGVNFIPLVTPTSKDRIKEIASGGGGFIYCVSVAGVTGERKEFSADITDYMKSVAEVTEVPRAIGFGISSPEMASKYKELSEGIIVGSAIVRRTLEDKSNDEIIEDVSSFVKSLKDAIR
ncbi:tryptophan synthase alpha chain [Andreesenia angusta]|uniref:Tryptophan synthase alpha chain n=1 Tax=Andreesenia angusta TaxID=39480 RepID=A0A1S1V9C8_9FIRM|nr:tryptophan synthase subunit alpha [Andreesenia angusta]OHW63206.1 tryptophan synthase alpha chain [Andreesenia angusta]